MARSPTRRKQAPTVGPGRPRTSNGSFFDQEIHREEFGHHEVNIPKPSPWKPKLRLLLCGTRDNQSPLSILRGHESTVVKHIYTFLLEFWKNLGVAHSEFAFLQCGHVVFPPPEGRNVNMMPFIMGDKDSLPDNLQPYYDTVIARCRVDESEIGKVGYLTVMESFVKAGETQRRPGLHVEAPGPSKTDPSFTSIHEMNWGSGVAFEGEEFHGGLFLASSVKGTCKVWNALVGRPSAVDALGGIEPLRRFLGRGYELEASELIWLTDKTPHEALPQEESGHRQFFRLVTSDISVWFSEHSTSNPKVPLPGFVRVIGGNKFEAKLGKVVHIK